jgi:hypothetical protein
MDHFMTFFKGIRQLIAGKFNLLNAEQLLRPLLVVVSFRTNPSFVYQNQ